MTLRSNADRVNQMGQRIGAKGERTRQKLIDVTVTLLETHGLRDLTVAEIARCAETSPATFYVYFDGVPEALLAALETTTQSTPDLLQMLEDNWAVSQGYARARAFVEQYCVHWAAHSTVFRCRNLAAEEGDTRFLAARREAVTPLLEALAQKVTVAQKEGRVLDKLQPRASAGAVLTLLERLAAVGPTTPAQPGMSFKTFKDSAAFMVANMLGAAG
ncbi:MAG: TetR/AcrR family transcriptional regulator [Sphingomonadaceae bacterium]|nr:TetR/AcrR family transcriptional regulator [Sphingomonadaceae bacterium]